MKCMKFLPLIEEKNREQILVDTEEVKMCWNYRIQAFDRQFVR